MKTGLVVLLLFPTISALARTPERLEKREDDGRVEAVFADACANLQGHAFPSGRSEVFETERPDVQAVVRVSPPDCRTSASHECTCGCPPESQVQIYPSQNDTDSQLTTCMGVKLKSPYAATAKTPELPEDRRAFW